MTVYLVGAGPGNPEMLTLKAMRLLGEAEVVIHDRLICQQILDMVAPWAEMINVGKNPNEKSSSQAEIFQLLVSKGSTHRTVVRLKGGDPFVFGRGGEEVEALADAGINVEIVPGITSAIAGPAAAGIPVTHRGLSSAFTVLTGHQVDESSLDWNALAALNSTLVVLMGARKALQIRDRLTKGGMEPSTPVAVVSSATTSAQHVTRFPLAELGETPIVNPAVIVIGSVADEAELSKLSHSRLPLQGVPKWQ